MESSREGSHGGPLVLKHFLVHVLRLSRQSDDRAPE